MNTLHDAERGEPAGEKASAVVANPNGKTFGKQLLAKCVFNHATPSFSPAAPRSPARLHYTRPTLTPLA